MKQLPFVCVFLLYKQVNGEMESFIVGGNDTNIKKYPHSIYLSISCATSFMCGGSLLNQDFVLTAGHCLEDCSGSRKESVILKYGHEYLKHMQSTRMHEYKVHDYYDTDMLKHDIAIVSCKTPIPLGSHVKRVIIMQNPPAAKYAYIAGWGVMNEYQMLSKTLKHTRQKLRPAKVCKVLGDLHRGTFCAGPLNGLGFPEQGDSGSALMINSYIQIGIVSYKVEGYSLVVYTNASYYYQWIRKHTRELYCE